MDQDHSVRRPWAPFYAALSLPTGIAGGFVTVALGYRLAHAGLSVAAIAGLVSLNILPWTWKVLGGPVLDLTLSPRLWYGVWALVLAAALVALGAAPATMAALPLLDLLSLVSGVGIVLVTLAISNIVGAVEPQSTRGPIGGWVIAGGLGGKGLGGGAGLWLTQHAGGSLAAAAILAVVCLVCAVPILTVRTPPRVRAPTLRAETRRLAGEVWGLVRSRVGALALLLNLLPMGLGASNALWAAVSGDWKASADLVALVTGVLGGLVTIPGCLLGTALCRRFSPREAYYGAAVAGALVLVAMALAPHTPWAFVIFTLASALVLGTTWATLASVGFDCIGHDCAASKAAVIGSVSNLPVVIGVAVVGAVQSRFGSNAMLWTEAGMAALGLLAYTLISQATAPKPAAALA